MMFQELERINERPEPFQFYTAGDLWTDERDIRGEPAQWILVTEQVLMTSNNLQKY
jgi:hypothetical protein